MKFKICVLLIILFATLGLTPKKESKLKTTTDHYFDAVRKEFTGDTAYKTTAFVEKYWRVVGNKGFNKTVYRIAANLEKSGFVLQDKATSKDRLTYRIEKRPLKHDTWEPVDASLKIVGEKKPLLRYATNRNMIYKNSFSTRKKGIKGEVVYIKNAADIKTKNIKGKIVFTDARIRRLYQTIIVKGGAIGMLTYNNPAYLQPEKNVTSIQFRSLPFDATQKPWAIALSYEAKEKLKSKLAKGKVKVKAKVNTKIYPSEELTIIADIRGSELPKESMVFSAHIQEPGANDNATGVGVQLEMAMLAGKLVANKIVKAKRTLTFVWGDEIRSTRNYIVDKDKRIPDINWGISLDMVGENTAITGGSFLIEKMPDPSAIWTRGNDKHSEWGGSVLKLKDMKPHYLNDFIINIFKKQGEFANWEVNTNPFEGGSDHTPFLRANIPGLLLWHFTDQFYHTDNDRIDKVSKETLKNVGTGSLVSAFILINSDKDIAKGLIDDTLKAAKIRLQTEFDLSKKAIEKGSPKAKEIEILEAWNDWYSKSLASINDMVSKKNTLKTEIANAQSQLQKQTDTFIKQLEK